MANREEMLRAFVAEDDVACPGCGYNLRGLMGVRCPECDQDLVLRVGLMEPRVGTFVAGLVGISVGWGVSVFLFIVMSVYWIREGFTKYGPPWQAGVAVGVGFLLDLLLMSIWIRKRGWLRRQGTVARWAYVAGVTLLSAAYLGWFFYIAK